ncbi:hypothetical protein [Bacillus pumilus]|uniref:hypothetical protein n=1 Tax=Bacillus pumilus TaxID=1408 RepID=UPI001CD5CDE9|nr:hypothetical protein [Bacillus pumilus]
MTKKRYIKMILLLLAITMIASIFHPNSILAKSSTSPAKNQYPPVGQMTQSEIHMFLNNGERYNPTQSKDAQTKNIVTTIAKKLAVQALRKSGTYLEKPLSKVIGKKYAKKAKSGFYKVADYIEKVQNVQEKGIAAIFIQAGLPPDVAFETAKWIVIFFGL